MGQSSLIWDRAVSYGTEQCHMGQSSVCLKKYLGSSRISTSFVTPFKIILKLEEAFTTCDSLKKYLGHSGRTISFVTSFKNILKLVQAWQPFWDFYNFWKIDSDLQTLQKSFKNHRNPVTRLFDILRYFRASIASEKMFRTFRHSRNLLKIIQKYLQPCQTFWSFYNFRKVFGTSRHSRSLLKIIQKYLQACQTFWSFYNFLKIV